MAPDIIPVDQIKGGALMSAVDYLFGHSSKDVCKRVKAGLPDDLRNWVSPRQPAENHWRLEVPECSNDDLSRFMAPKPNDLVKEVRFSVPKGSVSSLGEYLGFERWTPGTMEMRDNYAMIRLTPGVLTAVTVERLKDFLAAALRATLRHNNLGL